MLHVKQLTCGYSRLSCAALAKKAPLPAGDSGFVIRDINLHVAAGEITGIIGPNGSGKTTLLRAITRMLKPAGGSILLEGKDIWRMKNKDLARKVAVVSQNAEAGFMTVEEFVLLGRIPYYGGFRFLETKNDLQIARDAMTQTDAFKLKDKYMGQISGGERQLALIARALAQEPTLLLLDEPTTYLDITHQVGILDLVRRLNKNFGLTVIMVLHDLNLAGEYCHRLALLKAGQMHKYGPPEKVLDYRIIEEVYKTVVVVEKNPISRKPYVLAISEAARELSAGPASKALVQGKNIRFVCSWSGGKDSCLALHRAASAGAKPACLLTIISEDGIRSKSHGLRKEILEAQASALALPLLVRSAAWEEYETVFIDALRELRGKNVRTGVFGDIDFPPHLAWEKKVCAQAGMTPCLPLWGCERREILLEFLALGYKAVLVAVNERKLDRKFLGRIIDRGIINEFLKIGIDPCGENGEYHTLVVDGPLFSRPLLIEPGPITEQAGYCLLDVRLSANGMRADSAKQPCLSPAVVQPR
ncbi:MAG: diphthine--ammonia ligase [Kiritimatiellae bacterium]|jgi:iron complex transport system ATP-binding protein|nr:diphthine--ammonia ligase [Kiritimatiellia bacterium]